MTTAVHTQHADAYSRPAARFRDGRLDIRASALGQCRRALWYAATEQPITNPIEPDSLTLLEAGNALEPVVVRAMQRDGWRVSAADRDQPQSVTVEASDRLTVTGHPDATGFLPPEGGAVAAVEQFLFGAEEPPEQGDELVIEIKTRGPEAFKHWRTLGAERSHPESVAQAACYSLGLFGEVRDIVIATLDTGARRWEHEVIPAHRAERAWDAACRRMSDLEDHYETCGPNPEALPERDFEASDWQCRRCPYLNRCQPGEAAGEADETEAAPAERVSDETAQAALLDYEQAQREIKAHESDKRAALKTLQHWLETKGEPKARLEGSAKTRTVGMVTSGRYSVDHKRLNALLDPEQRAEIVTEQVSEYVRVS